MGLLDDFDDVPRVPLRELTPQEKFGLTLELCETGFELKRQQFRRKHPDASEEEIGKMMGRWMRSKPIDYPSEYFKIHLQDPVEP